MPQAATTGRTPLYLHVGLPKSGSTFLQAVLAGNRERLKEVGYLYPFVRREAMFHAAVEIRDQHDTWGLDPSTIRGSWRQLCQRARELPGHTTIISHEILGGANPEQIAAAAAEVSDFDLHVVVTARDLSRQVPAHWQEQVKNGRNYPFAELEQEVVDPSLGTRDDSFWREQDLLDVLARWSTAVAPDHMHVVVCPSAGADRSELWRRFGDAVSLNPDAVDLGVVDLANESLGVAQVALLRQVNSALAGRLPQPEYAHVVKRFFAQRVLSDIDSPRAETPQALREQLSEITALWVAEIDRRGYRTHGVLQELGPVHFGASGSHPDQVTADEILSGVPRTVAALLLEVASLRHGQAAADAAPKLSQTLRGLSRLTRRRR